MKSFSILRDCVSKGGKILICGNGGSAADSEHMAGELVKSFILDRKLDPKFKRVYEKLYGKDDAERISEFLHDGIRAFSLPGQISFLTAFSNDCDFRGAFAQQVYVLGEKNDVLVGFTTSGNSENILLALKVAGAIGMKRIAFTGKDGGRSGLLADCLLNVPETETYKVQELHLPIYHSLCAMLEKEFHAEK